MSGVAACLDLGCSGDRRPRIDVCAGEFVAQPDPVPRLLHDLAIIEHRMFPAVDGKPVVPLADIELRPIAAVVHRPQPLQISVGERADLIAGSVGDDLDGQPDV